MITCHFDQGYDALLRHVVVQAIVEQDGKILLVKRAEQFLEGGKWALPGGYLNRNENSAEGALRELYEETGWEGEIIQLFAINSRPDRPYEELQNVAFDFLIKPIQKTGTPDEESSAIEWLALDQLAPLDTYAFDHGNTIKHFLQYRQEHFPLPLFA